MSFDQVFGGAAFGGQAAGGGSGDITLQATLEQIVLTEDIHLSAIIEQRMIRTATLQATLEQQMIYPQQTLQAILEQRMIDSLTIQATLEQQMYSAPTGIWAPRVIIDGVDYSDRVTGEITITRAENASAIATVTIEPTTGVLDLLGFVAKPIHIEYRDGASENWRVRRYTGEIAKPEYQQGAGLVRLNCTTDLQGALEGAPREQIDVLIENGLWSADVFDDDGDGWQYAQDRLSTVPGFIWHDHNRSIRFDLWAAASTADITYTDSDIMDGGEISVAYASKRDMIKRVLIEFEYEFFNKRTRQHHCSFQYAGQFCDYLVKGFKMPTKAMVRSAAVATGWQLDGISYTDIPPSDYYTCSNTYSGAYKIGFLRTSQSDSECMGAHFDVSKKFTQRVRENWVFDVRSEDDDDTANRYAVRESYGVRSEWDPSEWDDKVTNVGLSSGEQNDPPAGGLHPGGSGDYSEEADPDRRTEMMSAQQTVLAKAQAEVLKTHRETQVTFAVEMDPAIDLSKTVQISTPTVSAKGRITEIRESLNISTGRASSQITLAISRKSGSGVAQGDPIQAIDRPTPTEETPYERSIRLGFRIGGATGTASIGGSEAGGLQGASANDDEFNGYSTNYQRGVDPNDNTAAFYSNRMTVILPEIEQAAVDAVTLQAEEVLRVDVPEDPLTLNR